jgi:type II secretory pathway pseudopilin PulG
MKNKRFTLVELLVVIAIVIILVTMGVGAWQKMHGGSSSNPEYIVNP